MFISNINSPKEIFAAYRWQPWDPLGDPSSGVVLSVSSSFFFSSYRFTMHTKWRDFHSMRRDDSMEKMRFSPLPEEKKNTKSQAITVQKKRRNLFCRDGNFWKSPNPLSVTFVHPQLLWGWQKHALHDNSIPGIGIYETPGTIIGES